MGRTDETLAALDVVIAGASVADRPALVVQLASRLAALGAGMAPVATTQGVDRNLDVASAAARLGMSEDWLYRNASELPFVVRLGRRLLFSERGIEAFLARRRT